MKQRIRRIAFLVSVCLLLSACGGTPGGRTMTTKTYTFAEVWDKIAAPTPFTAFRSYEGPMDDDVRERLPESVFRSNAPDYNYSYIDITEGGRVFCFYTSQGLLIPNVYTEFIYQTVRLASDDFAAIAEGSPVSEAEALEPGIQMIREARQNEEEKSPEALRVNLLLTDGLLYLRYEAGEDGELRLTEKRMYPTFMRFVYCKDIDGKTVEWLDRDTPLEVKGAYMSDDWRSFYELNATVLKEDMV